MQHDSIATTRAIWGLLFTLVLCGCATASWEEANKKGTVEAYQQFLTKYPDSEHAKEATQLISDLQEEEARRQEEEAWRRAESVDTTIGYETFLAQYSESRYTRAASTRLEALRFEEAQNTDSVDAYESYLRRHPDGANGEAARRRMSELLREAEFAQAKEEKTLEAYEDFIEEYVDGPDVEALRAELPEMLALKLGRTLIGVAPKKREVIRDRRKVREEVYYDESGARFDLEPILERGANPNLVRIAGFKPGKMARCNYDSVDETGRLLAKHYPKDCDGAHVVLAEKSGMTLLRFCRAAKMGRSVCALLVKHGAK